MAAEKRVITRMAPSPTGHLHVGTVRTALFNYLYAKHTGGEFILRMEDTDTKRSTPEFESEIIEGLAWLGITADHFYRQSERTELYQSYLQKLIDADTVYTSKEESTANPGTIVEVIRLRNPNKTITFEDEARGEVSFDTTELGDFVIARSITDALYHFAVVVDDFEMGITHVIRGEDHISNTPRQILIQEAIGAPRPIYTHVPLLLAPDRSKLSKRHGAVSLIEYKDAGYLPAAIINYLALLGWNPGTDQELFNLDALLDEFSLGGIQKGGAIFSVEKMRWFNREHLLLLTEDIFLKYVKDWISPAVENLPQFDAARLARLLPTIRERIHTGLDIQEAAEAGEYAFAFASPDIDPTLLQWKNDSTLDAAVPRLQKLAEILSTIPDEYNFEAIKEPIWQYADAEGRGEVLWPLRVALTGRKKSPDPFTIIHIIGTAEAYKRVQHACDIILSQG